jgi:hypothetical protein
MLPWRTLRARVLASDCRPHPKTDPSSAAASSASINPVAMRYPNVTGRPIDQSSLDCTLSEMDLIAEGEPAMMKPIPISSEQIQ